ncbi:MAG: hypothetical protein QNJ18_19215 [Xenococcaceae cyanobacterium MO_167.B52]|nr:hypothetical protein [Xenococcaceae cyanobacterium MO_167.B52]
MSILKSKFSTWLFISIIVSILFGCAGLKLSFESAYTIQDDARQYIFWMQQFKDSSLFQDDLIADYFKSVTPWGFTTSYKIVSYLGLDIFWFNKVSPLVIGLVTTLYCFLVCLEFLPVPLAGFFSCLLLTQNLWMVDDLSSGTPRAFIYCLLLGFIYYFLKQNILASVLFILLQGLFYPQTVLLSAVILVVNLIRTRNRHKIYFWCLFTASIVLSFYAFQTSDFGNVITVGEARLLSEFREGGRSAFFTNSWSKFWLTGRRSGFFPIEWQYVLMCSYGIFIFWIKSFPKTFPLGQKIDRKILILGDMLLASIIMFSLAHLFLFRFHLPGRYSQHTIRIVIALLDGIVLSVAFDFIGRKINYYLKKYQNIFKVVALIILCALLLYPTYAVQSYPHRLNYVTGKDPQLYKFLQQQPKDSMIASLSEAADFIPSLTARSVLVAKEYAIPYHQGYYGQFRERVKDLIAAQYSVDITTIHNFIDKYNVDFWLLEKDAFKIKYLTNNQWLMQFQSATTEAIKILERNQQPLLQQISDRCTVFKEENLNILSAKCIMQLKIKPRFM